MDTLLQYITKTEQRETWNKLHFEVVWSVEEVIQALNAKLYGIENIRSIVKFFAN